VQTGIRSPVLETSDLTVLQMFSTRQALVNQTGFWIAQMESRGDLLTFSAQWQLILALVPSTGERDSLL
jgi:hypothetical protein